MKVYMMSFCAFPITTQLSTFFHIFPFLLKVAGRDGK